MKNFLKSLEDLKPSIILKVVAIILICFAVLAAASSFFQNTMVGLGGGGMGKGMASEIMAPIAATADYYAPENQKISVRNAIDSGQPASSLEIKEYYTTIETLNSKETCQSFSSLKGKDYIIFENANDSDRGCNYNFKVKKEKSAEILSLINGLDPKDISENSYTIKQTVDDITSQVEALQKKKDVIEDTLNNALKAYDEISQIAKSINNAESLAKIIDSKVGTIERLTQEKMNINAELDRLQKNKTDQLDKLNYVYFHISIYENKYVDWQNIKDSWKIAAQQFVMSVNGFFQDITINLVAYLFRAILFIIYFFIVLFVAKYGWRFAKNIWNR